MTKTMTMTMTVTVTVTVTMIVTVTVTVTMTKTMTMTMTMTVIMIIIYTKVVYRRIRNYDNNKLIEIQWNPVNLVMNRPQKSGCINRVGVLKWLFK